MLYDVTQLYTSFIFLILRGPIIPWVSGVSGMWSEITSEAWYPERAKRVEWVTSYMYRGSV